MPWSSVDEKLPATHTRVLVLDELEGCITAFYNAEYNQWFISCNRQWYSNCNRPLRCVTCWMSLPKYNGTDGNLVSIDVSSYISIDTHNSLVSKLASEVYVVIGSLYASNGEVSDSTYESVLDKMMDIIDNPSILQSDKDLLVPFG